MLRKMRWHFIGAAMAAMFMVVLILLCTVNIWNYTLTTERQDASLHMLLEVRQRDASPVEEKKFQIMPGPFGRRSPEMGYMLRFFVVRCDTEGNTIQIDKEFIASVTSEEAASFAKKILAKGKTAGYWEGYRYLVDRNDAGSTIVFLNSEREIQSLQVLLWVSLAVALLSLLAVFVLVLFFSKRAIAPYIRNLETQKRFITDAGHELKTPLTAISTSADILAMEYEDDEWVRNIQNQSARLAKLVSNLVTLSRLDEEQPFLEKTDFSLSEAVWEISEPMAAVAQAKGKAFEQSIEDGIFFHGDRSSIQQMVSILLDNAVKYSDENGSITLDVHRSKKKIKLTVSNTGAFRDLENVDRLFDRFYRPDQARSVQSGGTGIGLSIAKATAELHGGSISAEVHDETHITFTVLL